MTQKRIVLTGHGAWDPKSTPQPFVTLPAFHAPSGLPIL
jgi:hypothetical protein